MPVMGNAVAVAGSGSSGRILSNGFTSEIEGPATPIASRLRNAVQAQAWSRREPIMPLTAKESTVQRKQGRKTKILSGRWRELACGATHAHGNTVDCMVWYGMVDVCDGYLAAESNGQVNV